MVVYRGHAPVLDFTEPVGDLATNLSGSGLFQDRPSHLIVRILLPRVDKASGIEVDVCDQRLLLTHEAAKYRLDTRLL